MDAEAERMMSANRANWDARTPIHESSAFYGLDGSRSPFDWFAPFEWDDLGSVAGLDVLHLQCHLGADTLAFAEKGARTTGLDLSARSIEAARRLATRAGLDVEYVEANVYDAASALGGGQFELIYTGKGALCYLPDLARWAHVVADLLRPGGSLYVVEFHPLFASLGPKPRPGEGQELHLYRDYLGGRGAEERDATYTYTDGPALTEGRVAYEWAHGLGDVITALLEAGLRITSLRESELLPWPRWKRMVRGDGGWWRLPDEDPRIPLLYGLKAAKA